MGSGGANKWGAKEVYASLIIKDFALPLRTLRLEAFDILAVP